MCLFNILTPRTQITRGSEIPGKATTSSLKTHMKNHHPEAYSIPLNESVPGCSTGTRKRACNDINIFRLRSKKERSEFLQSSIPDWIEANTTMDINHPRAQKIHKSIFEMMLIDRMPFTHVNNPGFLRHHYLLAPNFDVGCDKYYRDEHIYGPIPI